VVFRPLSQRENPTPDFEGPHDGIPPWIQQSVRTWVTKAVADPRYTEWVPDGGLLRAAETALHVARPFAWGHGAHGALNSALTRMREDGDFGLDLLDFLLHNLRHRLALASELQSILTRGGSAWEVRLTDQEQEFELVRRTVGPVTEAIEALRSVNARAHAHLTQAWSKLMGRNPDPSSAYREAIRAVEVVAAPVVIPDDPSPTLGKVISAMTAKPEKWSVDLAEATPQQATEMVKMIWQSQVDRHGTHDPAVPLNVSQEQADAAVHISIALVRLFAGGHVQRVSE
jgi:hypothetical protein